MLLILLSYTLILAGTQVYHSVRYYPESRRASQKYESKTTIGNIPLKDILLGLLRPTTEPIDGVFGTEACCYIGLPILLLALSKPSVWLVFCLIFILLTIGKHTPLFKLTSPIHLRIPARYSYFIGLTLVLASLEATRANNFSVPFQSLILLVQAINLVMVMPKILPMEPYCQRWERPLGVFDSPLVQFLAREESPQNRTSGLPYPLRTGQINGIRTLGYNGGSQSQKMANFRKDKDPNGSGGHDWFMTNEDSEELDNYGVRFAYTHRPLTGKWKPTIIPHLYENTQAKPVPNWNEWKATLR